MNITSNARKQNSAAISHPSLLDQDWVEQRGQWAGHSLPQMHKTRKEEAQAHIGLSSHGYYY
jgi:hypothetical protein